MPTEDPVSHNGCSDTWSGTNDCRGLIRCLVVIVVVIAKARLFFDMLVPGLGLSYIIKVAYCLMLSRLGVLCAY